MIEKKTDIFAPELYIFPTKGKNIDLGFSNDRLNGNSGLLLLCEPNNQLNLLSSASIYILDGRDIRYID